MPTRLPPQDGHKVNFVFGSFFLDVANERLRRGQEEVRLPPTGFALLRHLVEHSGQMVTKDALLKSLWQGLYVTEAVLSVHIAKIREVLRDDSRNPRFIETVHGRGYRFIAPVSDATKTSSRLPEAATTATLNRLLFPRDVSPYPGLRAFKEQDRELYFGREREIDALISRLQMRQGNFTAVVGASGSGKSSLIYAGLLPRLKEGAIVGSENWTYIEPFTPGEKVSHDAQEGQPLDMLAVQLRAQLPEHKLAQLGKRLFDHPTDIVGLIDKILLGTPKTARLVLFIDQFEELFTEVNNSVVRTRFLEILDAAVKSGRSLVLLALRADFYERCLVYPALGRLLQDGTFALAPPDAIALCKMITGPAEVAGLCLEDGLVDALLRDACSGLETPEPGALPLLAFVLDQLYWRHDRRRRKLTQLEYKRLGTKDNPGIRGAIGRRAEEVFSTLPENVQAAAGEVFRELVHLDDGGRPTRRRADIRSFKGQGAREIIKTFSNPDVRLLTLDTPRRRQPCAAKGDQASVEVAHEALFDSWPMLRRWLTDHIDALSVLRQMQAGALEWDKRGRDSKLSWSNERVRDVARALQQLGGNMSLTRVEQEFLGPIYPEAMCDEVKARATDHRRRALISERLAVIGDPRPGTGLGPNGLPDIEWCDIQSQTGMVSQMRQVKHFRISKYLVTYAQYKVFLEAQDGYRNEQWWGKLVHESEIGQQLMRYGNHPADHVSWWDAVAFCRWVTQKYCERDLMKMGQRIRLPTELEWWQVATGGDPIRIYPWGEDWDSKREPWRANCHASGLQRTTAVGMYPAGASAAGALDILGNVWEWCDNKRTSQHSPIRGGSWFHPPKDLQASSRLMRDRAYRTPSIGFRLAQDTESSRSL